MVGLRVKRAEVKVAKTTAESIKNRLGLVHGGVDVLGVCDVAAQSGIGKLREHVLEFAGVAPERLARIHVLDCHKAPQSPKGVEVADYVWMHGDSDESPVVSGS